MSRTTDDYIINQVDATFRQQLHKFFRNIDSEGGIQIAMATKRCRLCGIHRDEANDAFCPGKPDV
jgi:hypothetical protein